MKFEQNIGKKVTKKRLFNMRYMEIKSKVVMLEMPHKNSSCSHVALDSRGTILPYDDIKTRFNDNQGCYPQYLYLTIDEEIKDGDWYIIDSEKVFQCINGQAEVDACKEENFRKILATNDESLHSTKGLQAGKVYNLEAVGTKYEPGTLPQIPQSFIKQYCEAGGIDEVIVEMEEYIEPYDGRYATVKASETIEQGASVFEAILDSNNCIIIKLIEESWTREEVEALLYKYFMSNVVEQSISTKEWIKQNL